jgi:hypothetical protein
MKSGYVFAYECQAILVLLMRMPAHMCNGQNVAILANPATFWPWTGNWFMINPGIIRQIVSKPSRYSLALMFNCPKCRQIRQYGDVLSWLSSWRGLRLLVRRNSLSNYTVSHHNSPLCSLVSLKVDITGAKGRKVAAFGVLATFLPFADCFL